MPFEVPPLPYAYDALEPHIDEETMRIHHDKHHQAYVDKLNAALEGTDFEAQRLETVLENLAEVPEDRGLTVRNNGGGHFNHLMFWESMHPDGGADPQGELAEQLAATFETVDDFREQFEAAGVNRFGSGWVWLVYTDGGLAIETTPNQDTPLAAGQVPLLGNDVWEHAYYLRYQNRRPDYLKAWWSVVNWDKVAERYAAASA